MINRKVLFAALCLSTTTVFAVPFNGFYVGAGIGGTQGNFDIKQSIDASPTVNGAPILHIVGDNNGDLTDSSLLGNLNIGYGHALKLIQKGLFKSWVALSPFKLTLKQSFIQHYL